MTLTLHQHPFASYCWKVLIALYERGVPFESRLVEGRDDLALLWPWASIPVLVDGDVVLGESTIVIEHLDRHGDAPPLVGDLEVRLWDRVLDGQVMTPMQRIVADALRPDDARDPYGVDESRAALDRAYTLLDDRMEDRTWMVGERFSLADCAAAPALFYGRAVHRWDEVALPALTAYLERLVARPSVARVVEEARPYRPLFPLGWPDYVA